MRNVRTTPTGETQRQLRVGEQMRHVLAELLARGAVHDPGLREASLTISEVRVSRDLRRAVVFALELGGGLGDDTRAALARASPFLRGEVARQMHLKYAPDLVFEADPSFAEAARIERVLAEERERREREGSEDDGEA
jgi:ribosome-binding factor A